MRAETDIVCRYCPNSTKIAVCPTWRSWKFVHHIAELPAAAVSIVLFEKLTALKLAYMKPEYS